jgi:hypothetical protein
LPAALSAASAGEVDKTSDNTNKIDSTPFISNLLRTQLVQIE